MSAHNICFLGVIRKISPDTSSCLEIWLLILYRSFQEPPNYFDYTSNLDNSVPRENNFLTSQWKKNIVGTDWNYLFEANLMSPNNIMFYLEK